MARQTRDGDGLRDVGHAVVGITSLCSIIFFKFTSIELVNSAYVSVGSTFGCQALSSKSAQQQTAG